MGFEFWTDILISLKSLPVLCVFFPTSGYFSSVLLADFSFLFVLFSIFGVLRMLSRPSFHILPRHLSLHSNFPDFSQPVNQVVLPCLSPEYFFSLFTFLIPVQGTVLSSEEIQKPSNWSSLFEFSNMVSCTYCFYLGYFCLFSFHLCPTVALPLLNIPS